MNNNELRNLKNGLDNIVKYDVNGNPYWSARELMPLLGYIEWRKFEGVIEKAMMSAVVQGYNPNDHFAGAGKIVQLGSKGTRQVNDYLLTKYACYLIAMNGDPRKKEIAFAQAYFAYTTNEYEQLVDAMNYMDRKPIREKATEINKTFNGTLTSHGVSSYGIPRVISKGDQAFFGGNTTQDMKERVGCKPKEPLDDYLDPMVLSLKTAAKEITKYNINKNDIRGEDRITKEHVDNNIDMREFMYNKTGDYPEEVPGVENYKKLERKVNKMEIDDRKYSLNTSPFIKVIIK